MAFFISDAVAQTSEVSATSGFMQFLPLIILFVVFYFLLIRPQQKKQKEHRAMVAGLQVGDEVVTMGGIVGKVSSIDDNFVSLKVTDNTELQVQRAAVQMMMPKGTVN